MRSHGTSLMHLAFAVLVAIFLFQPAVAVLGPPNNVCVNETQVCWSTIQEAINNATVGQTVIITNATNYNETIELNNSVFLTRNTTQKPLVYQHTTNVAKKTVINVTASNSGVSKILVKYNGSGTSTLGITIFNATN